MSEEFGPTLARMNAEHHLFEAVDDLMRVASIHHGTVNGEPVHIVQTRRKATMVAAVQDLVDCAHNELLDNAIEHPVEFVMSELAGLLTLEDFTRLRDRLLYEMSSRMLETHPEGATTAAGNGVGVQNAH